MARIQKGMKMTQKNQVELERHKIFNDLVTNSDSLYKDMIKLSLPMVRQLKNLHVAQFDKLIATRLKQSAGRKVSKARS